MKEGQLPQREGPISRRDFLVISGTATIASCTSIPCRIPQEVGEPRQLPRDITFRVLRDRDLLNLEFRFLGFEQHGAMLRPRVGGGSRLVIRFPGQNVAEQVFDYPEAVKGEPEYEVPPLRMDPPRPVHAHLAGPTWLVFEFDDSVDQIPLDPGLWLRLVEQTIRFPMVLPESAVDPEWARTGSGEVIPIPPRIDQTALELPFRLFLAPTGPTSVRSSRPCASERYQELWHMALRSAVPIAPTKAPDSFDDVPAQLGPPDRVTLQARAFYSPDHVVGGEPPFGDHYPGAGQLSLHDLTRHLLVQQIMGGNGKIDAEILTLSPLGANARLYYASQSAIKEIEARQLAGGTQSIARTELYLWIQNMVLGRDDLFVEAFFGWLFPFQLPAVYVEVSERLFAEVKKEIKEDFKEKNGPGAFLLKRRFILVLDQERTFLSSKSPLGRMMPLKHVVLEDRTSPDLKESVNVTEGSGLYFWPKALSGGNDVRWNLTTTDVAGQKQHTPEARLFFGSHLLKGRDLYSQQDAPMRTVPFPSQEVAYTDLAEPGESSTLETSALTFDCGALLYEIRAARLLLRNIESLVLAQARAWAEGLLSGIGELTPSETERIAQWVEDTAEAVTNNVDLRRRVRAFLAEIEESASEAAEIGTEAVQTIVRRAQVILPALKGIVPDVPRREIEYIGEYVTQAFGGLDGAQNGVYARLTEVIDKGHELANEVRNGLASPAVIIGGLSRELGAVAAEGKKALQDVARKIDGLDIANAIPDAKLFGVLPLRALIPRNSLTKAEFPELNDLELPDRLERSMSWEVPVEYREFGILEFVPQGRTTSLSLRATTTIYRDPPRAQAELKANLDAFNLVLLDLIEVQFGGVTLESRYALGESPGPPNIAPDLRAVRFRGPLEFVNTLQEKLKGLFGDEFQLDIDSSYIRVGVGASLPPISFGVVSLRNIALTSRLSLPLLQNPLRYEFALSSFRTPFELSVMGFAGRGSFMTAFDTSGLRELRGSFEFGGALSFDIGIASGGLYVMAGAYYEITNGSTQFSGYLRAGGGLDVLGLIHVSVEFFLGMRYRAHNGQSQLFGFCQVTVSIEFCFFSIDVNLRMEKQLAGSRLNSNQALLQPMAVGALQEDDDLPIAFVHRDRGRFRTVDEFCDEYWRYF
jgi:hypothetical protein